MEETKDFKSFGTRVRLTGKLNPGGTKNLIEGGNRR